MDPITIGIVAIAAVSGVVSTLAGIATKKMWKKVTKTEAAMQQLQLDADVKKPPETSL